MLANRVSYFFNLHGPSITLDTACSSGLVAIHEACKSIRGGEVKQALVGGANLIIDPDQVDFISSMSYVLYHSLGRSFLIITGFFLLMDAVTLSIPVLKDSGGVRELPL